MYRNVNLDAHLSALLFLAGAGALILLAIATGIFLFWRRAWVRYSLAATVAIIIGYGVLLLAFSGFSREHTLKEGQEKYFCELDCHLAYSVQKIERVKTIGGMNPRGIFYAVTLRTRFDETTTAPWRPHDVPLRPDPLSLALVDDHGRSFGLCLEAQRAWEAEHGRASSLLQPLRPGESYETTLIFDVPADVTRPRLLASFAVFPTQVLIGDENSLLHHKTYFAL